MIAGRDCVAFAGAYNALTARQAAKAGFQAVYVSGAGLANATAGVPDIGLLSREEVALLASWIAAAVDVPVIADADTGFGGVADVAKTIRQFEASGLAGLHIEDQVFPKRCGHLGGKEVVPVSEMVRKIRSAVRARKDDAFLVIARTDARAVEGFDAAVDRAKQYIAAGADAIFPEALETREEFARFVKQLPGVPLLANMTEFGRGPLLSVRDLASIGYRMAIFPQTALRIGMKAQEVALREVAARGTQKSLLKKMQTRQALYDLLDYDPNVDWPGQESWPGRRSPKTR